MTLPMNPENSPSPEPETVGRFKGTINKIGSAVLKFGCDVTQPIADWKNGAREEREARINSENS